jgi:dolichyl-phosphate beta-glucosyltransferase
MGAWSHESPAAGTLVEECVTGRTIVVIPCYNEATRLDLAAFSAYRRTAGPPVGFLFVDDGSSDGTLAVLERLAGTLGQGSRVLHLERNAGKAEAVRHGILSALDENPFAVGFWDADLATPLEAIDDFRRVLSERPGIEMVFGARVALLGRTIQRQARRHYSGRVFATVVSLMLHLPIYDTQCGAKLFRVTPTLRGLFDQPFISRWVFDVEIIARQARAARTGRATPPAQAIYEYPLERWADVPGSKLGAGDFARAVWEVARIGYAYRS